MSNSAKTIEGADRINNIAWAAIITILSALFFATPAVYIFIFPEQNEYMRTPISVVFILAAAFNILMTRNSLIKFRERIRSAKAVFESSSQRKKKLQAGLIILAETLSSDEANIHHSVVSEMREAVGEIGQGGLPSFVLANLAARFPNLNNVAGFTSAQRSAVEIESKIDVDMREVNEHVRVYNEIIHLFPTNIVSYVIGFRAAQYLTIED